MKIIDISMAIYPEMAVYKNKEEKKPVIEILQNFERGVRESKIHLELHTGTHMDAPLHMVEGGETTNGFQTKDMVIPCRVFDLTGVKDAITRVDLEPYRIQKGEFILFKTRNSFVEHFDAEFVYLREDGARYLAELGIRGVGTDALGIERSQSGHETHVALLEAGILILEGLRLKDVEPGEYLLIAAPLKIMDVEASPVRALLVSGISL